MRLSGIYALGFEFTACMLIKNNIHLEAKHYINRE